MENYRFKIYIGAEGNDAVAFKYQASVQSLTSLRQLISRNAILADAMISIDVLSSGNVDIQLLHQQVLSVTQSLQMHITLLNPGSSSTTIQFAGREQEIELVQEALNAIFNHRIRCSVLPLSLTNLSNQVIPADGWSSYYSSFISLNEVTSVSIILNYIIHLKFSLFS